MPEQDLGATNKWSKIESCSAQVAASLLQLRIFHHSILCLRILNNDLLRRLQQVFFSYGLVLGVGVGCVLDTATLMVGQVGRSPSSSSSASSSPSPALMQSSSSWSCFVSKYFKRRREAVEVGLGAAGGLGFAIMFLFVEGSVRLAIIVIFVPTSNLTTAICMLVLESWLPKCLSEWVVLTKA